MRKLAVILIVVFCLEGYCLSLKDLLIDYSKNSRYSVKYESERDKYQLMVKDAYHSYIAPSLMVDISAPNFYYDRDGEGSWEKSNNESLALKYDQNLPYNITISDNLVYNTSRDYNNSYSITLSKGFIRKNPSYLDYLQAELEHDLNLNQLKSSINYDVIAITNLYFNYQKASALHGLYKKILINQEKLLKYYEDKGIDTLSIYIYYKSIESSMVDYDIVLRQLELEMANCTDQLKLYGMKEFDELEPVYLYERVNLEDLEINNLNLQDYRIQSRILNKVLKDFKNSNTIDITLNTSYDYTDFRNDEKNHNINAWIGIKIPVFTRNKYQEQVLRKNIEILNYEQEIFMERLKTDIESSIREYNLQREIIEIRRRDAEESEKVLDIARELLSSGSMSYFEFQTREQEFESKIQNLEDEIINANLSALNILSMHEEDLLSALIKILE